MIGSIALRQPYTANRPPLAAPPASAPAPAPAPAAGACTAADYQQIERLRNQAGVARSNGITVGVGTAVIGGIVALGGSHVGGAICVGIGLIGVASCFNQASQFERRATNLEARCRAAAGTP